MALLDPTAMGEVFRSPMGAEDLYEEAIALWHRDGSGDAIDRTLEFFTNIYLPDNILTKVDRASMMFGLESRAVFLDNDVAAFCQRLPNTYKFRKGRGKVLLRKALARKLPAQILDRPKKGFGIPLAKWLREMPDWKLDVPVGGVDAQAVTRRWLEHRAGRRDHRMFLWGWLVLQHQLAATP
jgi:asparagine synthase (glutamine-hydrolysing)